METIKIIDKRNGVVKEVNKNLVNDYLGTGDFEILNLTSTPKEKPKKSFYVNENAKSKF